MTIYDENKQNFPELDDLKTAKNDFLKDIYLKAFKYQLSPRQIAAAQKALATEKSFGGQTPFDINKQKFPEIDKLSDILKKKPFYDNYFISDVLGKAARYILSDKQLDALKREYNKLTSEVIELDEEEIGYFKILLNYFNRFSRQYSPMGDIADELLGKISTKNFTIDDKKKMFKHILKYKKSMFKYIFNELKI